MYTLKICSVCKKKGSVYLFERQVCVGDGAGVKGERLRTWERPFTGLQLCESNSQLLAKLNPQAGNYILVSHMDGSIQYLPGHHVLHPQVQQSEAGLQAEWRNRTWSLVWGAAMGTDGLLVVSSWCLKAFRVWVFVLWLFVGKKKLAL